MVSETKMRQNGEPVEGRQVYIKSWSHYQIRKDPDGSFVLLEYTTGEDDEACPGMGHRGSFKPEEGKIIERFQAGEKVEFIYSSYQVEIGDGLLVRPRTEINGVAVRDSGIDCGDDLTYLFQKNILRDPTLQD